MNKYHISIKSPNDENTSISSPGMIRLQDSCFDSDLSIIMFQDKLNLTPPSKATQSSINLSGNQFSEVKSTTSIKNETIAANLDTDPNTTDTVGWLGNKHMVNSPQSTTSTTFQGLNTGKKMVIQNKKNRDLPTSRV